jgi:hypothetical protein
MGVTAVTGNVIQVSLDFIIAGASGPINMDALRKSRLVCRGGCLWAAAKAIRQERFPRRMLMTVRERSMNECSLSKMRCAP